MAKRRYWLMKSEPGAYSFADLMSEEEQTAEWDGIRNYQARNNMQEMKKGDGILFYHSQANPQAVVGTAVVIKESYPDDTALDPNSEHPDPKSTPEKPIWFMVDIKGEREMQHPVTLKEIKETPELANMVLVKNSRLSVQPVTEAEWKLIMKLGMDGGKR